RLLGKFAKNSTILMATSTKKAKKLTPKELLFCEHYLVRFNGADSAVKAGYSKKTAREMAYELLTKPHVREYIDKRIEELLSDIGVNQRMVVEEIAAIAFAKITDFVTIEEFEVVETKGRKKEKRKI